MLLYKTHWYCPERIHICFWSIQCSMFLIIKWVQSLLKRISFHVPNSHTIFILWTSTCSDKNEWNVANSPCDCSINGHVLHQTSARVRLHRWGLDGEFAFCTCQLWQLLLLPKVLIFAFKAGSITFKIWYFFNNTYKIEKALRTFSFHDF
jgi:hypothetical protein